MAGARTAAGVAHNTAHAQPQHDRCTTAAAQPPPPPPQPILRITPAGQTGLPGNAADPQVTRLGESGRSREHAPLAKVHPRSPRRRRPPRWGRGGPGRGGGRSRRPLRLSGTDRAMLKCDAMRSGGANFGSRDPAARRCCDPLRCQSTMRDLHAPRFVPFCQPPAPSLPRPGAMHGGLCRWAPLSG